WGTDYALEIHQVEVAATRFYDDTRCISWLFGDDVDQPAHDITAKQGTLRTSEHLNPFDVEQGEVPIRYPPLVHAIDEHGDGLIQPGAVFAGLCTTQGWQRLHPGENCEVHARNVRSDIFRIHDSGFCDVGVRKSSYGCRHVLERLLSFLSRYDYFLELSLRSRKIRTDDQKCH